MLDPETSQQLTDAEEVRNMTNSRGWGYVHAKLIERILDLQNINNVDASSPETLAVDIKARKMASDLLYGWLKADVFGFIEQQAANATEANAKEESYIDRGDG